MLFSSIPFLYYFLPCVLIVYFLVPKQIKNVVLLLASLIFYAWGEPAYVFLMAGSILIGYLFGILIGKFRKEKPMVSKICCIVSIGISLCLLGYFKYANFFITNFNAVTGLSVSLLKITLPIGISFYTFQLISYIIDVYWGTVQPQKNLISLATYITMFPQLIAGPIVRYSDVEKELSNRTISSEKIAYGIRRFVFGLSKKILIANVLGEFCSIFRNSDEKSILFYWAYAIAISLHIYFDFSGYSDMAIGLGSILGFHFPENFNYPFISKSMTEFWRRWHMSLGTWFRDYVYIPLGGSRRSPQRNLFNVFVVWFLTGMWHGAEWTFIIWGLYFAILLSIEKSFFLKWLKKHTIIAHSYVLLFGIFSFIIFDAITLKDAWIAILAMFGIGQEGFGTVPILSESTLYYLKSFAVVFVIAIFGATPLPKQLLQKINENHMGQKILSVIEPIVVLLLLLVSTGYLVDGSFNPFLYFRF
ncbi:MAG: MBOAT family protein [Lachnospiraceae bacterium]|nr:MBOAT family protein [Lachnospiraceae bacterium]